MAVEDRIRHVEDFLHRMVAVRDRVIEPLMWEIAKTRSKAAGEFDRTVELVLRLKGSNTLLDEDPALQRAVRLRNPYVDPMSLLQVNLLTRWRAAGRPDDELFRALLATVRGIAQGLQNTG